jgi:DNA-directed RNA polymerase II subunit GRINL1A
LKDFNSRIEKELENRNTIDNAAKLFSDLNITSVGVEKINQLEWNGNNTSQISENIMDSDDDVEDELAIIVNSANNRKKHLIVAEPEKSLITESDLQEIQSFQQNDNSENANNNKASACSSTEPSTEMDGHALYLCGKEHMNTANDRQKFLPHKTTKSDIHNPEKEKLRKKSKYWENTAATPPLIKNSAAKLLTLCESIDVEQKRREELAIVQEEHAQERLKAKEDRSLAYTKMINAATQSFTGYRETENDMESDDSLDSDDQVLDEDEDMSGVAFPVND